MELVEYRTTMVPQKRPKNATVYYLTQQQRHDLIQNLGDACYIVFMYYAEKASYKNFSFHDDRVAKALGYSERKVQRARQKLIQYGWFLQSTYTNKEGRKVIMTYLGQEAVHHYKKHGQVIRMTEVSLSTDEKVLFE